jgi:hypothetical protein
MAIKLLERETQLYELNAALKEAIAGEDVRDGGKTFLEGRLLEQFTGFRADCQSG